FRVHLQGNVKTVLTLMPVSGGWFNKITDPDEIVESHMELTSNVDEPIKLQLQPNPAKSPWELKVDEVTPGKKWNNTLTTAPPLPSGYLSYQYRFSTGNPRLPTWTLFASAFRPERICAEPQNMIFPNTFNTVMPPPTVTIENYGKTLIK